MDRKIKTATTTLGILAGLVALGATAYAVKHKKDIKKSIKSDLTDVKDRSLTILHNRIGYPVYDYLKRKENIPF